MNTNSIRVPFKDCSPQAVTELAVKLYAVINNIKQIPRPMEEHTQRENQTKIGETAFEVWRTMRELAALYVANEGRLNALRSARDAVMFQGNQAEKQAWAQEYAECAERKELADTTGGRIRAFYKDLRDVFETLYYPGFSPIPFTLEHL